MRAAGEEIKLVRPSMEYAEDIMRFREEFLSFHPEEDMGGAGNLRDCERAQDWIAYVEALNCRETCPEGLVDADTYLAVRVSDNKIVGITDFRHHINHPILGLWGGHIGYCVRPDERRKGYASEMLRQNLDNCRARGLRRVMITCNVHNVASERTILSCGGRYEKTVWSEELKANMKRYWIELEEKMGFAKDFLWGAASAAHQVEGAYLEDGKGLGIWDALTQEPGHVAHGENGNVSCDHYHRYKEDVALMKKLGLKSYRFSVSWPRVMPEGSGKVNQAGLDFYVRLTDELINAGIEPMVTLFHWNLPMALYEKGGWKNPEIAGWFEEYARVVAQALKGKVKYWMTINEPQCFIGAGMLAGIHAPFEQNKPEDLLPVSKNVLLAHGRAVKALREICPGDIKVGYAPATDIVLPKDESEEEIERARKATFSSSAFGFSFSNVWWSDPMFLGKFSDMDEEIWGDRLPRFTKEEWELVSQPLDFYGFNAYQGGGNPVPENPYAYDRYAYQGSPRTAMDWNVTPDVLYWGCRFFYERYQKPLMITENGMAGYDVVSLDGKVHDPNRQDFVHRYLLGLKRAVTEGYPVLGYQYWSILDNFEWANGYDKRFGLVYVDYRTGERIVKDSAYWYSKVIETNGENLGVLTDDKFCG